MNFQIETSNHCNFECGYCPNKDMKRKREFMSDQVWDKILNQYVIPYRHVANSDSPPTAIFHKDSETLLDRKLPGRLKALPSDIKVDIYSNGVLLPAWRKRGEDFIELLASLPNKCRLLLSYHPRNHDNSANDYSGVIAYLREVLKDPPKNVEFITVSHKSKWVSEDMQLAWARCWSDLPITVHANCSINPWTGRMEEHATCAYNGCPYADFGHWFFGVTGNIIACCLDLEEEIVLGNVLVDDPKDMYTKTAEFYYEQRKTLAEKRRPKHAVCDNCYGYNRNDRGVVGTADLIQLGVPAV